MNGYITYMHMEPIINGAIWIKEIRNNIFMYINHVRQDKVVYIVVVNLAADWIDKRELNRLEKHWENSRRDPTKNRGCAEGEYAGKPEMVIKRVHKYNLENSKNAHYYSTDEELRSILKKYGINI